ncbi:ATP-binding cassette domain-containing protein [Compostimonas suwonensis]|uniref:ABC-2 type transport system ATP-binding protein n=1 Tax=Compostimonas suwonensis TaxID=1048394 RepID=A0A2M9BUG3_9MICO|nr:ATP-binding cassette domain-containing protein [Compostimonas suwonensis]PJJ61594.1 ABC-2 type transport system ATP-binding protein [Compostimonas suwonensis]
MTAQTGLSGAPVLIARGLRKSYGSHHVLAGIDMTVDRGEIFALLGPNGAGKTTTVNILTTLIRPDAGSARIAGVDLIANPRRAREVISLTGQYASVDDFQTGEENLRMMAKLAHLDRADAKRRIAELIERFDLVDAAGRRAGTYSGGMRRRLDLAISLLAEPPVVFLDEPTTGLDPRSRADMWAVVRDLATTGTTIILTTQYLEEADQLADRVAVLDDGRIIAEGTPEQLKQRVSGEHIRLTLENAGQFQLARRADFGHGAVFDVDELSVLVPADDNVQTMRELLATTARHELAVSAIEIVKPSLDDVFLALTGQPTAGGGASAPGAPRENEEVAA